MGVHLSRVSTYRDLDSRDLDEEDILVVEGEVCIPLQQHRVRETLPDTHHRISVNNIREPDDIAQPRVPRKSEPRSRRIG